MSRLALQTVWRQVAVAAAIALAIGLPALVSSPPAASTVGPVAVALGGQLLFGKNQQVWRLANGVVEPVTRDLGWWQPHASPDGQEIVAVGRYLSASEIFVLHADGSVARQLTRNRRTPVGASDWAFRPRWSPDGQTIAFLSDRTSFYTMLWRMNPDGGGLRQLTFPVHGLDAIDTFAWSPDGRFIAATRFTSNVSQIYLLDLARPSASRALTSVERGAFDPAWSPDGQFLAFVAREGGRNALRVLHLDDPGHATTLVEADVIRSPEWSPSGETIAYLALDRGNFEIFAVDVMETGGEAAPVGRPSQVTVQFGVDPLAGLSWTP